MTTTELQANDLKQAHKEAGLNTSWDSVVTVHQKNKL